MAHSAEPLQALWLAPPVVVLVSALRVMQGGWLAGQQPQEAALGPLPCRCCWRRRRCACWP